MAGNITKIMSYKIKMFNNTFYKYTWHFVYICINIKAPQTDTLKDKVYVSREEHCKTQQ